MNIGRDGMDIEPIEGPNESKKTILVMVDSIEAEIIREALDRYARDSTGHVADICAKLDAAFRWAIV